MPQATPIEVPEIVRLPDRILTDAERRKSEILTQNKILTRIIDVTIKELLVSSDYSPMSFYKEAFDRKLLNTETPFVDSYKQLFAFILKHSGLEDTHPMVGLLFKAIESKIFLPAENPWDDYRMRNRLDGTRTSTPVIRYMIRLQSALLRSIINSNELIVAELERIIEAYRLPSAQGKADFQRYQSQFANSLKAVVPDQVRVVPTLKDEVRLILEEAGFQNIDFDDEGQTWTAKRHGKTPVQGSWDEVINGIDPFDHRLFIEARREISAKRRQRSASEDD